MRLSRRSLLATASLSATSALAWPRLASAQDKVVRYGIPMTDIPLTTGIVVTYTTLFIFINVAIDIIYFMVDPRIRATQAA